MDQGHRPPQFAGEGRTSEEECRPCAISHWFAGLGRHRLGAYVTEDIDEKVVVVSGPEFDGLVVIPRLHISELEELSVADRAQVLAALQRATRSVREGNPGKTTKVVVMTDPPASEGHACYHVLSGGDVDPENPPSTSP